MMCSQLHMRLCDKQDQQVELIGCSEDMHVACWLASEFNRNAAWLLVALEEKPPPTFYFFGRKFVSTLAMPLQPPKMQSKEKWAFALYGCLSAHAQALRHFERQSRQAK